MPPLLVWKTRPSGVVPYRLMWARSSRTSSGGIGIVLVSLSARCLRPRSWREVPWSVQAVPAREAEAARTILPRPVRRQIQVGLAEHDRLRRAQRSVVQAAVERLQVRAPVAESADGGQEFPGLGGADHDAPVDGRRDGGGGPLDAVDGVGGNAAEFDGVAEGVVEHRPLAPLGRPGGGLPGQGLGARAERDPHGGGVLQRADRQGGAGGPAQGEGDLARRVDLAGGGVERPCEQCCPALKIPMWTAFTVPMWWRVKAPLPWWLRGFGGGVACVCG
jgi:hypothetical protein